MSFDVIEFYERKAAWSREAFGPKQTTDGVVAHLRSELKELRAAIDEPDRQIGDVAAICEELADICLLAIDLSWRTNGTAADFRGTTNCTRIVPRDAADYIGRHLNSTMPPAALAAVVWDLAFRALGCDGAPIEEKFAKLKQREWPDWRTVPADQPIEHVREPAAGDEHLDCEAVAAALTPAPPFLGQGRVGAFTPDSMSTSIQVELDRVVNAIADGFANPFAGLSQETFEALNKAQRAMARVSSGKNPMRHVALRALVARALVVDGMRFETPVRVGLKLGPCHVCGAKAGARCVTRAGEYAKHPHRGRRS